MDIFKILAGCIMLAMLVTIGYMAFNFILILIGMVIGGIGAFLCWLWGLVRGK